MTTPGQDYIKSVYGWVGAQIQKPSEGSEATQIRPGKEYIDRKIEAVWLRLRAEIEGNEPND